MNLFIAEMHKSLSLEHFLSCVGRMSKAREAYFGIASGKYEHSGLLKTQYLGKFESVWKKKKKKKSTYILPRFGWGVAPVWGRGIFGMQRRDGGQGEPTMHDRPTQGIAMARA